MREGVPSCYGGRVLAAMVRGEDLAGARRRAYQTVEAVHFENAYYRRDIAVVLVRRGGIRYRSCLWKPQ